MQWYRRANAKWTEIWYSVVLVEHTGLTFNMEYFPCLIQMRVVTRLKIQRTKRTKYDVR